MSEKKDSLNMFSYLINTFNTFNHQINMFNMFIYQINMFIFSDKKYILYDLLLITSFNTFIRQK